MKSYQLTYIVSAEVPSEGLETIKKEVETFVQENGGVIPAADKTPPQILAYPVNKRGSGFFITLEFQSPEEKVKGLVEKVKKEKNVLRHTLIVKKPVKQKKPPRRRKPLEQASGPQLGGMSQPKPASSAPKVELKDIDKKLDEILGE